MAGLRRAAAQGVDGPRRAQPHQGRGRHDAGLPLVVPDGDLRQLRHERQRGAPAHLRHLPLRLRAGTGARSSRSRTSRSSRDLVVDIGDFMEKLPRVKPWIIRDEEQSVDDGKYLQTPEELDAYKQFSMCINCMLCYSACPVYGLDPDFVGPAAIALADRYDLDSRDQGARERLDVLIEHEGVCGCTFVGECTRVCPKHVDPAGAIQRYKLKAAQESVKAFLLPRALRDESPAPADGDLTYRRPMPVLWWIRKRSYFMFVMRELSSIFIAWFVLYLLLFVRAVGRGEAAYDDFLDWAASPGAGRGERGRVRVRGAAHGHLVLAHAAGDGRAPARAPGPRRGDHRGAVRRAAASCPRSSFWLVTR